MNFNFTLYHGTKSKFAEIINSDRQFKKSLGIKLFLGEGIYFYDMHINAVYYNIGKYIENEKKIPTYFELVNKYNVVTANVTVETDEILDMNKYESKYGYIYACKKIFNRIKDNKDFKSERFKDGFLINFLRENSNFLDGYKLMMNIYSKKMINKEMFINSRIAFDVKQKYYCILDDSCINNIKIDKSNCLQEYNTLERVYNICK